MILVLAVDRAGQWWPGQVIDAQPESHRYNATELAMPALRFFRTSLTAVETEALMMPWTDDASDLLLRERRWQLNVLALLPWLRAGVIVDIPADVVRAAVESATP